MKNAREITAAFALILSIAFVRCSSATALQKEQDGEEQRSEQDTAVYYLGDAGLSTVSAVVEKPAVLDVPASPVIATLLEELSTLGVSDTFLTELRLHPAVEFDEKYTRINVVGTVTKPEYSQFYTDVAVRKCIAFLIEYDSLLSAVEEQYGVPREYLVAILYIETKLGTYTGSHHLPSVFLSVAASQYPQYLEYNLQQLYESYNGTPEELRELEQRLYRRSERKARWAKRELLALDTLYRYRGIDVFQLYGSWAGAFGYSQFLPSSYLRWGKDGDGDGKVDLFHFPDALHSIAYYLLDNGWGKTAEQRQRAIYAYNHSEEYVAAVITLAEKLAAARRK